MAAAAAPCGMSVQQGRAPCSARAAVLQVYRGGCSVLGDRECPAVHVQYPRSVDRECFISVSAIGCLIDSGKCKLPLLARDGRDAFKPNP